MNFTTNRRTKLILQMCKSRTTSRTGIEHETYSALGNKEETLNDVSNLGTGVQEEVDQTNPIQVSLANNDLESDQNTITEEILNGISNVDIFQEGGDTNPLPVSMITNNDLESNQNMEESLIDISNLDIVFQEEAEHTNPFKVSFTNNDLECIQNMVNLDIALSMPENLEQVTKGSSNTEKDFDLMDDDSMVLAEAENVECDQDNNIEEDLLLVDSCELQAVTENSAGVAEDNNIEEDLQDKLQTEEEILSEESENQERPVTGRPKKRRKRKYPDQTREVRKKRKNENKKYISQNGNVISPKEFRDYHCTCRYHEKVQLDMRKSIFLKFWDLGDYNSQNMFISSLVSEAPIKRKRVQDSKRKYTREYKLNDVVVCRTSFVQTLRISTKRVDTALKKAKSSDSMRDKRGQAGGSNRLTEGRKEEVRQHTIKIPTYKSHYCRSSTESRWLPTDYTLTRMYNLYKEEVQHPVSQSEYNKIFYNDFNLKRKALKKDTCSKCDVSDVQIRSAIDKNEIQRIQNEHNAHLFLVEQARKTFKEDFQAAKDVQNQETLSFDLQKTLPLPRIPTNIVYYKRQIMMYNLGIHSAKSNKGFFNVWVENMAGRGSQDVGSCLKRFICDHCPDIEHLVLRSDSCGGQNRNIHIVLMLKHILSCHPSLKTISMKFLMPGHSFLSNDSEFGDVECHLKTHQRVYTDDDYINTMKACRKKNPFTVTKLTNGDFFSTKTLEENITNRKVDIENKKINWLKIRQIDLYRDKPFSLFTRNMFDEPHQEIDLTKKNVGRRPTLFTQDLPLLWPNGKAISTPKMRDLKSMLNLIPADAKPFYSNFFPDNSIEDDVEGFNGEIDFDVEFE